MAVVPKLRQEEIEELGDITCNLQSLLFESALTDDEIRLLHLRKRSHALTVTACAQATHFVSILNEARAIKVQLRNPTNKKALKLLREDTPRDPLLIGIIGCGRLGSHVAHCLLTIAEVKPDELKISTRRPETLTEIFEKGVFCVNNNVQVATSVHILFMCVLPSQIPSIAEELSGKLPSKTLVYSLVSGIPLVRLKQLLRHSNIIQPQYTWNDNNNEKPWDYHMEITGTFTNREMLEQTCPLCINKQECLVATSTQFCEQLLYAFVNMCTAFSLSKTETTDIMNAVLLGHSSSQPLADKLDTWDISKKSGETDSSFPFFDLCTIANKDTPLKQKLLGSDHLPETFLGKYCDVFQQYLDWKNQAVTFAKKQIKVSFD